MASPGGGCPEPVILLSAVHDIYKGQATPQPPEDHCPTWLEGKNDHVTLRSPPAALSPTTAAKALPPDAVPAFSPQPCTRGLWASEQRGLVAVPPSSTSYRSLGPPEHRA